MHHVVGLGPLFGVWGNVLKQVGSRSLASIAHFAAPKLVPVSTEPRRQHGSWWTHPHRSDFNTSHTHSPNPGQTFGWRPIAQGVLVIVSG
jgi:hypothetical protein